MDKLNVCLTSLAVAAIILSPIPLLFNVISPVDAASRDSRTDAYRRSIDSCLSCTQLGPPGQSPSPDLVHIVWHDSSDDSFGPLKYTRNFMGVFLNPVTDLVPVITYGPTVAASESNIYVAWEDNNSDIQFKKSTDGGATFGSTINLSNNPEPSVSPQIAASGNNVYVIWQDRSFESGNTEVLYRRSTDGGATFGSTINLSNNQGFSVSPVIAVSGNSVFVLWNDDVLGNHEILYRRSTDGGATFSPTVNLSNNVGGSNHPSIAASGNNVYVVWKDDSTTSDEIFYRRSANGGATFGPTLNISNNAGESENPAVAAAGKNVYVGWHDDVLGNGQILFRKSIDRGSTFESTVNISNNPEEWWSWWPSITAIGNNIYIVWGTEIPGNEVLGNNEIFYKISRDGGSFESAINISNNEAISIDPAIAVSKPP